MSRVTVPACSAVARVMAPGAVKYSFGFETGSADSWALTGAGTLLVQTADGAIYAAHRGTRLVSALTTIINSVDRGVTGLTIGREYTFSAWVGAVTSSDVALGVSGIGSASPQTLSTAALPPHFSKLAYTFVATATSHTLQIILGTVSDPTSSVVIDDILLVESDQQVGADIPLTLLPNSRITLDERRAPFVQANLRIALPEQADLDLLDTRTTNSVRVLVTTQQTFIEPIAAPQSRTFDLLLHERDADHATASSVVLVCHSDEAKLIDAGNDTSTVDNTPSLDAWSLRAILSTMLESYGAVLEPGTADADFTVTTAVTNLHINPDVEVDAAYYITGSGGSGVSAVARSNTVAAFGTYSARYTCSAASAALVVGPNVNGFPVTPGHTYTFSTHLRSQVSRTSYARIQWRDSGGSALSTSDAAAAASSTSAFDRFSVTGVAPAGAAYGSPMVMTAGNSGGQFHYLDGTMFHEGPMVPYFTGSTPTGTYYSYAWTGTANASTSQRIRLDNRAPKLLFQDPGEKDWDLVAQLVQTAGLRFFCDDQRRWWLVNPTTHTVPGTLALENASRGRDRISRESGDWADAVVVKYSWIGEDGEPMVEYDAASAGGTLLLLVEVNRPYPGPGAAAAILARYQGRGRVQTIVAPPELAATPAMALTTALPATPAQEGYVASVVFTLDADKIAMSVDARDLEDA